MLRALALQLLVLFSLSTFCVHSACGDDRPNFVIFVADDMAWDDCGAYGNAAIRTPNIDRLAAEGMRFDRAYLTCSSCSPSRCSILTGRYPHSTGAGELHLPLPKTQTMLTKPLMDAGYWTAAVGKWHLGQAVEEQVQYRQGSRPGAMGNAWVKALKERPAGQPFFLWAAHSDPHRGYRLGAVNPPHDPSKVVVPPFFPDASRVREDLALYYDEVSRFDEHIGMVLQELKQQGLEKNTFVLVISDNGRPFPHCKTRVHVPGVRTPFIVRWPQRVTGGQVARHVVSTVDIAPTVLELAGITPLTSFQGESFARMLSDPTLQIRKYAFAEHNWHDYRAYERAVHSREFCYVRNWLPGTAGTPPADAVNSPTYQVMLEMHAAGTLTPAQKGCVETPRAEEYLFDVTNDPNCLVNLAMLPQFSDQMQLMRAQLKLWQQDTKDQFPGEDALTPDGFDRNTGKRLINAAHPSFVNE